MTVLKRSAHECARCGALTEKRPEVSPGKCPLYPEDHTHSPHDWKPVLLEVRVIAR